MKFEQRSCWIYRFSKYVDSGRYRIHSKTYLFFPYLLHGYYKYKYPEEYREWESKTQLEWYQEGRSILISI